MLKSKINLDIPIVVIDSVGLKQIILNSPSQTGINDGIYYHNIIFVILPTTINEEVNALGTYNKDLELQKENGSLLTSEEIINGTFVINLIV